MFANTPVLCFCEEECRDTPRQPEATETGRRRLAFSATNGHQHKRGRQAVRWGAVGGGASDTVVVPVCGAGIGRPKLPAHTGDPGLLWNY